MIQNNLNTGGQPMPRKHLINLENFAKLKGFKQQERCCEHMEEMFWNQTATWPDLTI